MAGQQHVYFYATKDIPTGTHTLFTKHNTILS